MKAAVLRAIGVAALLASCGKPPCNDPPTTRILPGTYRLAGDAGTQIVIRIERPTPATAEDVSGLRVVVEGEASEAIEYRVERRDTTRSDF